MKTTWNNRRDHVKCEAMIISRDVSRVVDTGVTEKKARSERGDGKEG